MNLNSNSNSR